MSLKWDFTQIATWISVAVVFLVAVSIVRVAVYTMSAQQRLMNQASISYSEGLHIDKTVFDWGEIGVGENKTENLTVTNLLPNPVSLSFYTRDWEPSNISEYLMLEWDYNNGTIVSQAATVIQWTLSVAINIPEGFDNFTFTIILNSEEVGAIMP